MLHGLKGYPGCPVESRLKGRRVEVAVSGGSEGPKGDTFETCIGDGNGGAC